MLGDNRRRTFHFTPSIPFCMILLRWGVPPTSATLTSAGRRQAYPSNHSHPDQVFVTSLGSRHPPSLSKLRKGESGTLLNKRSLLTIMGSRQVVRQRVLVPSFGGSIPSSPAMNHSPFGLGFMATPSIHCKMTLRVIHVVYLSEQSERMVHC